MLNSFYNERSAHYKEIEEMHPGHPDDLEMHWGQICSEIWWPQEDELLEEIEAAGYKIEYNRKAGRWFILP